VARCSAYARPLPSAPDQRAPQDGHERRETAACFLSSDWPAHCRSQMLPLSPWRHSARHVINEVGRATTACAASSAARLRGPALQHGGFSARIQHAYSAPCLRHAPHLQLPASEGRRFSTEASARGLSTRIFSSLLAACAASSAARLRGPALQHGGFSTRIQLPARGMRRIFSCPPQRACASARRLQHVASARVFSAPC